MEAAAGLRRKATSVPALPPSRHPACDGGYILHPSHTPDMLDTLHARLTMEFTKLYKIVAVINFPISAFILVSTTINPIPLTNWGHCSGMGSLALLSSAVPMVTMILSGLLKKGKLLKEQNSLHENGFNVYSCPLAEV